MKNKLIVATLFSAFLLVSSNVKAANFTDNQTVESNKTWTVTFTGKVGFDDATKKGITVTDSKGNLVNVGVQLGQDNKTVTVTAPSEGYTPGESYILNVGSKAHSNKGKALKNEYTVHFNIKNTTNSSKVTFKDKNLEKVVRDSINKPIGDLLKSDLQNITSFFDASNKGIKDISGIENLTSVNWINLNGNEVSDISLLQGLTNLQVLDLTDNQISNISALKGLTNLRHLYLSGNQISNISALSGLSNLEDLSLGSNKITDYSPVKEYYNNLVNRDFELASPNDNTISFPDKNLEKAIRQCINKPTGDIYKSDVDKITEFGAYGVSIQDISGIENLTSLQELSLPFNKIGNISALSGLTNLQRLELYQNQISDISSLKNLTQLKYIDLTGNKISNISALSGLSNLEDLSLSSNQIKDISALKGLVNLKYLGLPWNQVSDISALKGLVNLENLALYHNQISDISVLKELINLQYLFIGENHISITDGELLQNILPKCYISYYY